MSTTVLIEVKQVRTVLEGPAYQVDTDVVRTQNIDQNIFVFNTTTDAFEYVATAFDMQTYPNTKNQAELDGKAYYRGKQAVVQYDDESVATEAAAYTLARTQHLAREYQTVSQDFVGTITRTYTGEN